MSDKLCPMTQRSATSPTTAPPSLDPAEVDAFQFAGQDVFWLLEHWAAHVGDRTFFVWEPRDGADRRWTYAEFVADANKVAAALAAKGVVAGDKVLIHADNCPEAVLAWYGCARLGAVAVTTNTRSVAAEVEYFATHTDCVGAITQPGLAKVVTEAVPDIGWLVVTEDDSGVAATAPSPERDHEPFSVLLDHDLPTPERTVFGPLHPAGIVFTSGTTSKPKAVVHTHGNALWAARSGPTNIDMVEGDTYLIYLPFFHVNAQSWSIWTTLG
ncbi:MAG: AMP-binding protein, partial [Microthrixaceae bacterium]